MLRKISILASLVLVVGVLSTGCSSSGDSKYDFNGLWNFVVRDFASNCPDTGRSLGRVRIVQSGTTISLRYVDLRSDVYTGTCDPGNDTFSVSYVSPTGASVTLNGLGIDDTTMEVRGHLVGDRCVDDTTWIATLVSR